MPTIKAPATILVTGVNGYMGPHVVETLLKHGYSVQGAVRSLAKGTYVKKLFEEYGDRVQIGEVPDFNKPGAFDDAVKGVQGIVHLGSPMPQKVNDVEDEQQCTFAAFPEIKRFVLVSTSGNVMEPKQEEYTWTEADWFDTALKIVETQGTETPDIILYIAAKMKQERAMFDFVQENKGPLDFDVVSVMPPFCFGPPTNEQADIEEIRSGAVATMYRAFNWPQYKELPPELAAGDAMVDVRDVAELLVRSLFTEKAGGERFLVFPHRFTWQQVWDALNAEPNLPGAPVGSPGSGKTQWNPTFTPKRAGMYLGLNIEASRRP